MTFTLRQRTTVETLHLEVQEYVHESTGALHIHLAANHDPQNVFLVGFRTVPQDSTGVAHILEHTALCGSQRFPVRDPFFMMTRRSLNTFMNAFTSSDWTAYPFATCNRKDFDNLLQVYLDAAFFPCLNEMDFLQEGHRLEFAEMDNPESALEFKGVVFNEMKGAMSSPTSRLWQALTTALFPTQTYHYNSGGEPACIPELTHQQLKDFHATHYHPSNAVFFTYGDISAAEHQEVFEQQVMRHFSRSEAHIRVGEEQRFTTPQRAHAVYASEAEQDVQRKTHIVLAWLLDKNTDAEALMTAHLVSGVLLDHGGSPLRHALECSDLAEAPSPMCGLCDSTLEMLFCCGFEGSDGKDVDAAEAYILETLQSIAEQGVPLSDLEAQLHQLELSQREITGDGYPYGLQLILNALNPAVYDAPIAPVLDIDPILSRLRERIQDPEFIKHEVRKILDNPHRVTLVMEPDAELAAREQEAEQQRLQTIRASMDDAQCAQVVAQAKMLKERQEQNDDPDLLPKVTREDVPNELQLPQMAGQDNGETMPFSHYACATNGLCYAELISQLPVLNEEQTRMLPLFAGMMDELGSAERDYQQTQSLQASVTGGIGASVSIHADADDAHRLHSYFTLSAKALQRNQQPCLQLMEETLMQLRLDEGERMRELIAQFRLRAERGVTQRGHLLAMTAASAAMTPLAGMQHRQGGLASIQWIKALDQRIQNEADMQAMQATLQAIHEALCAAPRQGLLIAEQQDLASLQQQAQALWTASPSDAQFQPFALSDEASKPIQQAWVTSTQVNFCAKALPAVSINHPDAAALQVLSGFLRNNFLHRCIREQGGAYGGGARFNAETRTFCFFSYRDPRLEATLQDFDRSIDWMLNTKHEERLLEEAVLGVISNIDAPGSPAGEASSTFHRALRGRTAECRRLWRARILQVTLEDLRRVTERWLLNAQAHTAVITHQEAAEQLDGMDIISL